MHENREGSLVGIPSVLSRYTRLKRIVITLTPRKQGSPEFRADIFHWANSSSQVSACSVEPGTAHDVGIIVSARMSSH